MPAPVADAGNGVQPALFVALTLTPSSIYQVVMLVLVQASGAGGN
jgi:hypothetical protein